jgi:hypothetical protein
VRCRSQEIIPTMLFDLMGEDKPYAKIKIKSRKEAGYAF